MDVQSSGMPVDESSGRPGNSAQFRNAMNHQLCLRTPLCTRSQRRLYASRHVAHADGQTRRLLAFGGGYSATALANILSDQGWQIQLTERLNQRARDDGSLPFGFMTLSGFARGRCALPGSVLMLQVPSSHFGPTDTFASQAASPRTGRQRFIDFHTSDRRSGRAIGHR